MQTLQLSFLTLLLFTFLLSSAPSAAALFLTFAAIALLRFLTRPLPVLLLNYACYKPPPHRKCSFAAASAFLRRNAASASQSVEFMRNIFLKSGLGDETYAPPFIFDENPSPTLKCALQEAKEGIFSAVDSLLAKTQIPISGIDAVVVTCGSFSPCPSLSSLIVSRYNLKSDVKSYNLSGMGCSSGVIAVDFAAKILSGSGRRVKTALVVATESITANWYSGDSRPMLVGNCIFRVGCAATLVTNDPSHRRVAKMELVHSLRTHHGAVGAAYRAAFQEEDDEGKTGISLTKDLVRVAGVNLREHIKILAPRVLPLRELFRYACSAAVAVVSGGGVRDVDHSMPDFGKAFEHMCIHTGGKAVIENVERVLKLGDDVTEPARMSLNRFGNTSSSLVFYELAYFEAKKRTKKGDKMWMLAFGTGFKVGSLIWKWLRDSDQDFDNPWLDCIDDYPLKAW